MSGPTTTPPANPFSTYTAPQTYTAPDGTIIDPGTAWVDPTTGGTWIWDGAKIHYAGVHDPSLGRDKLNQQIAADAAKLGLGYAQLSSRETLAAEKNATTLSVAGTRSADARAADLRALLTSRMSDAVSLANAYDTAAKNAADFAANPRDAYASILYRNAMFGKQGATPFGSTGNDAFNGYGSALQQDYQQMFQGAQDALSRAQAFVDAPPPAQYYPHGVYPEDLQRLQDAIRTQRLQGVPEQQIQDNMSRWFTGAPQSASAPSGAAPQAAAPGGAPPALSFGAPPAAAAPDLAAQLRAIAASPNAAWLEQNAAAINAGTMSAVPPPQLGQASPVPPPGSGYGVLPANAMGGDVAIGNFARGGKLNTKALAAKGDHLKAIARHVEAGEKRALAEQKFQQAMMPPGPQGGQMGMPGAGGMPQGPGAPAPMLSFMGHATGGFAGSGQSLLDIRKQNSQVLPEPAVIMGAQTGRIYGTAAENGPERETNTGTGFRFTPEPGVSRQTTPQAQQQIVGEAETRMPPQPVGTGFPIATGPGTPIGASPQPRPVPPQPYGTGFPVARGPGTPIGGSPQPAWDPMNPATTTLNPNAPPATALEYARHIGRIRSGQGNIFDYAWLAQHGFSRTMLGEASGQPYSGPGSMAPPGPTGTQQPIGQMAPPQLSFGPVAAHAGGGYMAFAGGGDLASQLQEIAASPNRQWLQDNAAKINAGVASEFGPDNSITVYGQTYHPNPGESPEAFRARMAPVYAQDQTDRLRQKYGQYAPVRWVPGIGGVTTSPPPSYGPGPLNAAEQATVAQNPYGLPNMWPKDWGTNPGGNPTGNYGGTATSSATSSATATPQDMNNAVNTYIANQLKLQGTNPVLRPGQTLYDPRYLAPIWDKLKSGDADMLQSIYSAYSSIGISPAQLDGMIHDATPHQTRTPMLSFA